MIEYPGRVFFSRWEKPDKENTWLYDQAYRLCLVAKKIFMESKQFENADWKTWNVIELHGWDNFTLHLVWYDMLGVHPYPEETRRVVLYESDGILEEYKIEDPFLLHYSHKLIPDEPLRHDPLSNKRHRDQWKSQVEELYNELRKHAIIYHPGAHQKSSWEALQSLKRIEVINLPDEENPTRIHGWKIVEVDPQIGYADFSRL